MLYVFRTPSQSPVRPPMIRAQSSSPVRSVKPPQPHQSRPITPTAQQSPQYRAPPRAPSLPGKLPPGAKRPTFTRPLGQLPMREGESVTLECMFEAYPVPEVIWSRHGQQIQDGNR